MPAKLKVRVVAGRDLPVMDRASELTDAFVEVSTFDLLAWMTDYDTCIWLEICILYRYY